jgi:signal transduction histidine kinase
LINLVRNAADASLETHGAVRLLWAVQRDRVEVTVQDDGRGFDVQKVKSSYDKRGSFGLLNIEERAALIGGTSELHSAPGQGTTVRIIVPISE